MPTTNHHGTDATLLLRGRILRYLGQFYRVAGNDGTLYASLEAIVNALRVDVQPVLDLCSHMTMGTGKHGTLTGTWPLEGSIELGFRLRVEWLAMMWVAQQEREAADLALYNGG